MIEAKSLSRRDFLNLGVQGTFAAFGLSACHRDLVSRKSSKELHVFSWADYLTPVAIPEFQKRYGVAVVYDTYASNEALLAKLQAGASNYDVIVPTSYMVEHLKKLKLLMHLDHDKLPNFKNIMPRFQTSPFDPDCQCSVPYTWGTTGVGYNQSAFAGAAVPDDWEIFWDRRLCGRMTLLDDARETISMALKRRNHSYNTVALESVKQATSDLIVQKPLTMCYTSDQVIIQLASGDSLASLVYSGDAYQAARDNSGVTYMIPKNGASLWTDNLCIPALAPNLENAYLWLNFMMEPAVAAATSNYTRYASPNAGATKMINADVLNDKNLYPPSAVLDKCEQIGDVGQAIFLYDRMWTELKCS